MIEDEITDLEKINNFYQENNKVKKYCKPSCSEIWL